MLNLINLINKIYNLPFYLKRILIIVLDITLCSICVFLAFYLRLEKFIKIDDAIILVVLISVLFSISIFWLIGMYKGKLRFVNLSLVSLTFIGTTLYASLYFSYK